ncbi:uncharacterized protein UBRO_21052 [Ustilago bromivora]|uniref:Transposase Tc1-like domain-containing protein n=1 Tax=Ustilago bromivora TaxID=307758 RepID=A0A1K0FYC8_9BASI|nr:uncharacterized protein UBRO_21052 [Ustilago bromivora]
MVHGNELSPMQCASIVAMHDTGLPIRRIAELSGVSKTAVHKTIHNFKECGSFKTKARSGHLRSWTATSDWYLQREVLKNPFLSWQELSASLGDIPITQLQKAAYQAGINHRIVLRKLFLTIKNWQKRLYWAKANSPTDWKHALFMDEAAVKVGYWPRHTWVSCQKSTQEDINNIVPTFCSSRFSTHIWAGIAYNLKTLLVVLPLAPRKK